MKTNNIVHFPQKLPSGKNITNKELRDFQRSDLVSIQVCDEFILRIQSVVIEQGKDTWKNLSRQQKRNIKRNVQTNLDGFSKFMKSKNKVFPKGCNTFEEVLELIHTDVVKNEIIKQSENESSQKPPITVQ